MPTFLDDLPEARRALAYAEQLHGGQRRESDYAPFILHPLEVASLLHNTGHAEYVVVAGILHDTLEDTDARAGDIEERFGADVAELVEVLTEDPALEDFEERKAALRRQVAEFGDVAVGLFAADKVAAVRELRSRVSRDPSLLEPEAGSARLKLDHYRHSLDALERVESEHPLVRQLRFELEALQALPPRRGYAAERSL